MARFDSPDPSIELSNLVALARLQDKSIVDQAQVLETMKSPWARGLAEALLADSGSPKKLSKRQACDLDAVNALAGVR